MSVTIRYAFAALALSLLCYPSGGLESGQPPVHIAKFSIGMYRIGFEAGVDYGPPAWYKFQGGCVIDDTYFEINWGDGDVQRLNPADPISQPNGDLIYQLRADRPHTYSRTGFMDGVLALNYYHCKGEPPYSNNTGVAQKFRAAVNSRVSLLTAILDSTHLTQAGQEQELILTLAGQGALEGGGRVYLEVTSGGNAINPSFPVPPYVDIVRSSDPQTGKVGTAAFRLADSIQTPTQVTIAAKANNSMSVTFTATPATKH